MSAYQDYIISLTPNHYLKLETDSADYGFGSALTTPNPTSTGVTYPATPLTKGSTNAASFDGTGYLDFGDAADTNITNGPWFRRSYSMWAKANDFLLNYMLYSEGGSVRNMTTMFALGGTMQYIADNDGDSDPGCPWSQSVVSGKIKAGEAYHLGFIWESDREDTGPDGKNRSFMRCFLNGRMIGEKEIYQWDNTNNEEIKTEPGGQLNAHSGNIVVGQGRAIIVSKKVFTPNNLKGSIQDIAIWDNVLLTDDTMWELFERGAQDTTATLTLTNVEAGSEVRLFDSQAPYNEIGTGTETAAASTIAIDYIVASTIDARMVILTQGKKVFSEIVTLPREGTSYDASLILKDDRTYRNP